MKTPLSICLLVLALGVVSGCTGDDKRDKPRSLEYDDSEAPTSYTMPYNEKNVVVVVIDTSMGKIKVQLFPDKAPITVKNFLQYVDDKFYDGKIFHRVIKTFMIQGGGMDASMKEATPRATIKNEAGNGLSNKRGTLAMARTNDPDSASAQFFINVVDNDFLDRAKAKDRVGYAVFGQVVEGMDVADRIRQVKTGGNDVPTKTVLIKSIRRAE